MHSSKTSAAYVGAVIFHPCKKWSALDQLWGQLPSRQSTLWKDELETTWELSQYMNKDVSDELSDLSTCNNEGLSYIEWRLALRSRPASQQPPPSLPASQRRSLGGQVQQPEVTVQQELAHYLSEPPVTNIAFKNDPIAWWRDVGVGRFPRLSYMAVDFLTIASSLAETERDFSSIGRMITLLRNRLRRSSVARAQCLRSWGKVGVYKPSIQFNLLKLNNENWRRCMIVATLARED
jgi:hAT family C-terminal dimerisation region